jgi:hypothetical protein
MSGWPLKADLVSARQHGGEPSYVRHRQKAAGRQSLLPIYDDVGDDNPRPTLSAPR